MAEQFAFQQRFGKSCAVDRQKGPLRPATVVVQSPRDQLFAGAAFAQDQHVDILGGDTADGFAHFLHDGTAPDDAVAAILGRQ